MLGSWTEVLQRFKDAEPRYLGIVFQRAGYQMQHAVAVWSIAAAEMPRVADPPEASHLDEAAAWEWLWLSAYPGKALDWTRWAELAGLHPERHVAVLERAMELRLIYPDGGVNQLAVAWLRQLTAEGFQTMRNKQSPPSSTK